MALATAAWMLFKITPRRLPYPKLDIELDDLGFDGFRYMKAPTLILWGKRDLYFPPRYGMPRPADDTKLSPQATCRDWTLTAQEGNV